MATVKDLKAQLDELGVEYSPSAKKAELEALLAPHIVQDGEDVKDMEVDEGATVAAEAPGSTAKREEIVELNGKKYKKIHNLVEGTTQMVPLVE